MIVTSISKNQIYQLTLPNKVKGQYWLYTGLNNNKKLVCVEEIDNKWFVRSNIEYRILNSNNKFIKKQVIEPLCFINVRNLKGDIHYIFCESSTDDRKIYEKYVFKGDISLSVGRNKKNDIVYQNKIVSSFHLRLNYKNNKWFVKDLNSANGVFVNGKKIQSDYCNFGDVINIMGLKIILGRNFLALNKPDNMVNVTSKLHLFVPQPIDMEEKPHQDYKELYFYRSPYLNKPMRKLELKVESPPESPVADETPLLVSIGTSAAMGMMSIVMITNAILNKNYLTLAMGICMLLSSVMLPIIVKTYEKNRRFKNEKVRLKKYEEYLESIAVKIDEAKEEQKQILEENISTSLECANRIINIDRNLWNKSYYDNNYLNIRVGTGKRELEINLKYDDAKFSINDDCLVEEMSMLCKKEKSIENAPIFYSLEKDRISGFVGKFELLKDYIISLAFQLASQYSYDELKFVLLLSNEQYNTFSFFKWMPHIWSNDNKFRYIARNNVEVKELSAYFEKYKEEKENNNNKKNNTEFYIVFSLCKQLEIRFDLFKSIFENIDDTNFSVVSFYEHIKDLPKETTKIIELGDNNSTIYDKRDINNSLVNFMHEPKLSFSPEKLSRKLSNIYLFSNSAEYSFPSILTFLEMFEAGKISHLNILSRWKENDPTKSLAAPVGVDSLGDLFMIDIHEKFHGPHGLIAGMTGSGKSEFIITYILSLAINYHPNEVAFVLIDYKGGGMAKSFENLPHTVGIITNLDGASINRSLMSIESELKRRQQIFSITSKKIGVSNIDIYKYQQLYRENIVDEPLPHLLIISDEFAELKAQRPEFMSQLVSAARIGRSLGIHLILATQKPSGVVDDQIWSNSRFRVCLKVQERADSQDMLKRPDAAELKETGRFFLQVGYNELFDVGQSAWSGSPYVPLDNFVVNNDESIEIIDINAHEISKNINKKKIQKIHSISKQVDAITQYINDIVKDSDIKINKLWLKPIPSYIDFYYLNNKYKIEHNNYIINPCIGEYDDPSSQCQNPLYLPISQKGNVIIYGSSNSGKTTLCNAILYSSINTYTPDEVHFYICDFSSETLNVFKTAPHVGDVVFADNAEKINNLFKFLTKEITLRKKLFSNYGGEYSSFIQNSTKHVPSIIFIIHNYSAFIELYENKEDDLLRISREGIKYGVYIILTVSSVNGVKFKLSQNFNTRLCLQLNDSTEYSSVVGRTEGMLPSNIKGRGLVRLDKLYEFQTASICKQNNLIKFIEEECEKLSNNWEGNIADSIKVLPKIVDDNYLKHYIVDDKELNIPIGVYTGNLKVCKFNLQKDYINFALSETYESSNLIYNLFNFILNNYSVNVWFFDANPSSEISIDYDKYFNDINKWESNIDILFDLIVERHNKVKKSKNFNSKKKFSYNLILINSIYELFKSISKEHKEKLSLILEKGSERLNVNFLISEIISNISTFTYDTWYKENTSTLNGIWCGNGVVDQFKFKIVNLNRSFRANIPPDFGYIIKNGHAYQAKMLHGFAKEEQDEV